eukprot:3707011-Rhodomonas_salina.1
MSALAGGVPDRAARPRRLDHQHSHRRRRAAPRYQLESSLVLSAASCVPRKRLTAARSRARMVLRVHDAIAGCERCGAVGQACSSVTPEGPESPARVTDGRDRAAESSDPAMVRLV